MNKSRFRPQKFLQSLRAAPAQLLVDGLLIICSLYLSLLIRVGPVEWWEHVITLNLYIPLFVCLRLATFAGLGIYRVMWRYTSLHDAIRLFSAVCLSTVFVLAASYFNLDMGRLPRSLFFIDALLATAVLLGARLQRRLYNEALNKRRSSLGQPTLVIGAGVLGQAILQRLRQDPLSNNNPIGYIDDDPQKRHMRIQGLKVLGTRQDLSQVIEDFSVEQVLVAISQLSGEKLREIIEVCRRYQIRPRIISGFLNANTRRDGMYRDINLNDLLNRPARRPDLSSVRAMVEGKTVLVTGSGGSIGSELSRQLAYLKPARLLLLDHSEYALSEIDRELRPQQNATDKIIPLLVDLKQPSQLKFVFETYRPQVVFHAAAYKHVHLVESNFCSAILNNVLGTKNLLDYCLEFNVDHFVTISSDKAVNPVGAMGATKRLCEILTTFAAFQTNKPYVSVRFGNVLGSSGSLIPLLKNQIEQGGSITITHQDMTRYFMLIPEAVSLVLRASTLAKPGDIGVLRMGEPVKIVDIARSLLALMGKTEEECPIEFTGLRPGEKMFEELYLRGDELNTDDPDILVLPKGDMPEGLSLSSQQIVKLIEIVIQKAHINDPVALNMMFQVLNGVSGVSLHAPDGNQKQEQNWSTQ